MNTLIQGEKIILNGGYMIDNNTVEE